MLQRDETDAARRILRRGTVLLVAVAATVIALALLDDTSDDFSAALSAKHDRISSLSSPKVVIIGGSNAVFGIDSELLQAELRQPVVNMALLADVGLPFMLKEVEPYLRRGDLLIIAPEYELFYQDALGDQVRYRAAAFLPHPWTYMTSASDLVHFGIAVTVERAQATVQITIRRLIGREIANPVYSRRAFNEFGDVIAHLSEKGRLDTTEWNRMSGTDAALDGAIFSALDAFASRVTRHGVTTVLMPPAILDLQYRREKKSIDRVFNRLSHEATARSFQVRGTPSEFAFPAKMMFDTQYHLNREGREIRTRRMLDLLTEAQLNR